jgi:hypothetical protein
MRASTTTSDTTSQLRKLVQPFITTFSNGDVSAVSHLSSKARSNLNVLFDSDGRIIVPMTNGTLVINAEFISFDNGFIRRGFINSTAVPVYHLLGSTDNERLIYIVTDFLAASSIYAIKKCPVYVTFNSSNLSVVTDMVTTKFPDRNVQVIHGAGSTVFSDRTNVEFCKSSVCSGCGCSLWRTHRKIGTQAAALLLSDSLHVSDTDSASYFQSFMRVTKDMLGFVDSVAKDLTKQQTLFLKHLLACTSIKCGLNEDDYFIPVPEPTISKYARGCDTFKMQDLRLISIKDEDRGMSRCREYAVDEDLFDTFVSLMPTSLKDVRSAKFVDLFTGEPTVKKPRNQKYLPSSNNNHPVKIPPLMRYAMDCISPRPVNLGAMKALLDIREAKMLTALKNFKKIKKLKKFKKSELSKEYKDYISLRGKYLNDRTCYSTVCEQVDLDSICNVFPLYNAAHRAQSTGRFTEIGGGLQSCSKEMKLASTLDVPNLCNYDLVSSQVNGLIQEFARFGLDTSWLENYRDAPNAKKYFANLVGVDVPTWKVCLLALIMGSSVARSPNFAVHRALIKHHFTNCGNGDDLDKSYSNFIRETKPLKAELDKWHELLIGRWPTEDADIRSHPYRDLKIMKNPTGMKFEIGKILKSGKIKTTKNRSAIKRKLAAFVLQGQEAAFVHQLTILSGEYNFVVVGNEHDGLITIGEIPEAAMVEAGKLSGLENPVMKTKDLFEGNDDWTIEKLKSDISDVMDTQNH